MAKQSERDATRRGNQLEQSSERAEEIPERRPSPLISRLGRSQEFGFEADIFSAKYNRETQELSIEGRFRHFGSAPLLFAADHNNGVWIDIAIVHAGTGEVESVCDVNTSITWINPGDWETINARTSLPSSRASEAHLVVVRITREGTRWFCENEPFAFRDPPQSDDRNEIDALHQKPKTLHKVTSMESSVNSVNTRQLSEKPHLVFDVSDLIQYFKNARLPTGIQRVQIEVITNLIFSTESKIDLGIACFTKMSDTWLEIPRLFFNHICKLALVSGETSAPEWSRVLDELDEHLTLAKPLEFRTGSYLINLGTSWWLQNYFLHVRKAKARFGIRYIPFVHDCIPIVTPEHCVEQLTRDFITWALGAFQHADHFLVNSHATAKDVVRVAAHLGYKIEHPSVVTLDADYRAATANLLASDQRQNTDLFLRASIQPERYVLFVSTIESRKNHLLAFAAWLTMLKKFGPQKIPKLVCVGNRGWLNDAIYAKLDASKLLKNHVVMLSKISDPDLQALYRNCLFTIYPSSYEGWGLPVTESLCYGKIPVLARYSSLPEAGGDFAEYFELGSESELLAILEKLIFDESYRAHREHIIRDGFRARPWGEIAQQVVSYVMGWAETDSVSTRSQFAEREVWPLTATCGTYYGLTENQESHIWSNMRVGEVFRQGDAWWWPEPWGCWTKPRVARLAFVCDMPQKSSAIIFVGLRGVQGETCRATVSIYAGPSRTMDLPPDEDRWVILTVDPEHLEHMRTEAGQVLIEILFASTGMVDFARNTNGVDYRVVSLGVRGFMICEQNDILNRMRLLESVTLGDLSSLNGRPNDAIDFGLLT